MKAFKARRLQGSRCARSQKGLKLQCFILDFEFFSERLRMNSELFSLEAPKAKM